MPADVSTPPPQGAVARLIAWSARNPVLTVILALASALWGLWGVQTVALDAIPDVSDTQVLVETGWPGRSPDLVEDAVTYPLTAELLGASGVTEVRGQSHFGTSLVTVLFDEDTDPDDARSRVLETLTRADLPAGASPRLGPDATALGWVFQYALVDRTGAHSLADLRRLQDTVLRFALLGVEGVAEAPPSGLRRGVAGPGSTRTAARPRRVRAAGGRGRAGRQRRRRRAQHRDRRPRAGHPRRGQLRASRTSRTPRSGSTPRAPCCCWATWRGSAAARRRAAGSPSWTGRGRSSGRWSSPDRGPTPSPSSTA